MHDRCERETCNMSSSAQREHVIAANWVRRFDVPSTRTTTTEKQAALVDK